MTKYEKNLKSYAEAINDNDWYLFELQINRRNGHYAIDRYDKDRRFRGSAYIGNYRECLDFLRGMIEAYYYIKAF